MTSRVPYEERQMHSEPREHRRRLLQMTLALAASSTASAATGQASTSRSGVMPPMQEAIQSCLDCHSRCLRMATGYCLDRGGQHVKKAHLRLLLNCAELCQTSANFMLSDSPLHGRVCLVCAEACEACAKSCEQVGDMRDCVEQCQRCAKSCRTMT